MARLAGKLRGDLRALEEQSNDVRTNPVRGRGATPSMGLSQFRGGRRRAPVESDEEVRGGGFLSDLGIPVVSDLAGMIGLGGAHHRTRNSASRMSEATAMGLHLGKHLHALHGAGFWDDFKSGFNSVIAPIAKVAKPFLPLLGPEGTAASAALDAVGYGRKRGGAMYPSGAYEGQGTGGAKTAQQLDTAARKLARAKARRESENQEIVSGAQALAGLRVPKRKPRVLYTSTAFPDMIADAEDVAYRPRGAGRERDDVAMTGIVGRGMLGQDGHGMRQVGAGRKKRAPAGPSDGRRKRAEIVRKIMAERGLSMIEASKAVKAEGLY